LDISVEGELAVITVNSPFLFISLWIFVGMARVKDPEGITTFNFLDNARFLG
jgi:hypothetical protein